MSFGSRDLSGLGIGRGSVRPSMKVVEAFFDRKAVQSRVDPAKRRVLSRFGAAVRGIARARIIQGDGSSRPGESPRSHTGLLKRFIFFSYDRERESVIIGPEKIAGRAGVDVPHVLEYGGTAIARRGLRTRRFRMKARPYMNPALEKTLPRLPQMWKNSVAIKPR